MFLIFLFAVVFSFYCWLASEPQPKPTSSKQRLEFASTKTIPPVRPTAASRVQLGHESKAPEMSIKEVTTEPFIALAPGNKLVLNNIDTLKIRSARKVASALGIKQKANGTDKLLKCLQQEIKQSLQSKPEELVIQALELAKVGS